jgi:hypothetical protein
LGLAREGKPFFVEDQESAIDLDLQGLSAGVYRAMLAANGQSLEQSIVVLR